MVTDLSSSYWQQLGQDLKISVKVNVVIAGLEQIGRVDAIVRDFGAENGMIVISDFGKVEAFLNSIFESGYGFSVMDTMGSYNRQGAIDILRDWGWTAEGPAPDWLSSGIG